MHTIDCITEFILKLEKNNSLQVKISKDKLSELVNSHFSESEIYDKRVKNG